MSPVNKGGIGIICFGSFSSFFRLVFLVFVPKKLQFFGFVVHCGLWTFPSIAFGSQFS